MHVHPFVKIFATWAVIILAAGPNQLTAADRIMAAAQIISANELLRDIHRQDPQRAFDFALEAQEILAAADGETGARNPQLRFLDTHPSMPEATSDASEIKQKIQKDFDKNPILREIYSRSPMASLRMLKRLREAAKKSN